jgi:outer membrane protein TolC
MSPSSTGRARSAGQAAFHSPDLPRVHSADYASFESFEEAGDEPPASNILLTGMATEPPELLQISDENSRPVALLEVIHLALSSNDIIPVDSQFLSSSSVLLNSPQAVSSIYDTAIQATGTAGSRGSVAASSDFVPVFSARSTYGGDNVIQNNLVSAGSPAGGVLDSETGNLQLRLEQQLVTGGRLELQHNTTFDANNVANNFFPDVYQGQFAVEFNQPLWSGAGDFFTSVAGPIDLISNRTPTVDQGIVVTRINEKLTAHQFQVALRQLIKDVTDVYQDLALTHRRYTIETRSRDAVESVWKKVKARSEVGSGDGLAAESQAEESYYAAEARVRDVLSEISLAENRLRRLTGVDAGDGRVIQPVDSSVEMIARDDWEHSLHTAMTARPELHESALTIESLELQRSASMNLGLPRLDLVSNFHVNGFGDRPFNDSGRPTTRPDSYYQNLLKGGQTGWFAGLEFSVPLDRRQSRSLTHQLEHRLAKARATLAAQKKEISHELWHAFRSAERWSEQMVEHRRRVSAATRQVKALDAAFPTGRVTVDLLIRAHSTLAVAETELARAFTEYTKSVADIRFRRGTLLEDLQIAINDELAEFAPPVNVQQDDVVLS